MSDVEQKAKRSKRLADDDKYIAKQMRIVKMLGLQENKRTGHRLHKLNAVTCGNSDCVMCANPRKLFNDLTIQEKRQMIEEKEFFKNQQEIVDNEEF